MYAKDLNRVSLLVNLASTLIGIVAYSMVAPRAAVAFTIFLTLCVMAGSYAGSYWVSSQIRVGRWRDGDREAMISPRLAIPILIAPAALCAYEVLSLIWLNAPPSSVSWPHFAAASTLAFNIEYISRQS